MLKDLIRKEYIVLNADAEDCRDAIVQCMKPLIENGAASEEYLKDIFEGMKQYGPYFVICPHVALPHGRSECGALRDAIGITVLKTPVYFDSRANDPVKYLFPLSSVAPGSHMSALAELSDLLGKKEFYELLDSAKTPQEVLVGLDRFSD